LDSSLRFQKIITGSMPEIGSAWFVQSWAFLAARQSEHAPQHGKYPSGASDSLIHRFTLRKEGQVLGWSRLNGLGANQMVSNCACQGQANSEQESSQIANSVSLVIPSGMSRDIFRSPARNVRRLGISGRDGVQPDFDIITRGGASVSRRVVI
jgi:hypothetical protein